MPKIIVAENQVIVDGRVLDEKVEQRDVDQSLLGQQKSKTSTQFTIKKKEFLKDLLDCAVFEVAKISDRVLLLPAGEKGEALSELVPELKNVDFSFQLDNMIALYKKVPVPIVYSNSALESGIFYREAHEYLKEQAKELCMISLAITFDYADWKNPYYSPIEFQKEFLATYTSVDSDSFIAPYTDDYYLTEDPFEDVKLSINSDFNLFSLKEITSLVQKSFGSKVSVVSS
ncbi:hypothetical protein [Halomicronema sp. CCY15110]|uniref:hypothetical protein n=1 Tax=Halomicronema sp. CCY15110 TaxID=2767773 RepID=UPI001952237F|nr:hypothetical protein [Halomicronema sp. CCY15110]